MFRLAVLGLLVLVAARGAAAETNARDRGALLYETHCLTCHTEQVRVPAAARHGLARSRDARAARRWSLMRVMSRPPPAPRFDFTFNPLEFP